MNSYHQIARQNGFALAIGLLLLCSGCEKQEPDEHQASVETPVVDGASPARPPDLFQAVIAGNIAEIKKSLDAGADINAEDALDRTPLHIAAFYGRTKIIDLLVANGADVNAADHTAMTPLHAAVISGGRQAVQLLLDRQADLQARNDEGQNALHLAAATGQPRLTRLLIERGADPRMPDSGGRTPLYYAKKNYHPQTTALLEEITRKKSKASGAKR
jgi:ankyrin repeat protein